MSLDARWRRAEREGDEAAAATMRRRAGIEPWTLGRAVERLWAARKGLVQQLAWSAREDGYLAFGWNERGLQHSLNTGDYLAYPVVLEDSGVVRERATEQRAYYHRLLLAHVAELSEGQLEAFPPTW